MRFRYGLDLGPDVHSISCSLILEQAEAVWIFSIRSTATSGGHQ